MGLFDFLKPKMKEGITNQETLRPQTSQKVQIPDIHLKKEMYSEPKVIQQQNEPEDVRRVLKPQTKEKSLPNFFHIDIYHIFKHEPSLIEKSVDGDGNPVEKYTLNLKEMELSTFCKVHIIRFEDDTYNLVFTGDINEIKDDLKEFVQYCAVQFGPDFMRKEGITEGDYRDMMLGVFSRIWYNHLCIENSHFTISLTLYHISNNRTNV